MYKEHNPHETICNSVMSDISQTDMNVYVLEEYTKTEIEKLKK